MTSREERLQRIYDEQGRPGAEAFRFAVNRSGQDEISIKDAKAFVAKQSIGQVFRGYIPSDGKILGGGREDQRWQMDLIDFSKRIEKINQTNKYVLVAVDNFDRTIFTEVMPSKSADTTLTAFRKIISDNDNVMPKQITVDLDGAFAQVEGEIRRNGGVLTRKNMHAVNTLAVVDRVIAKLKVILSAYNLHGSWAENMARATRAYNAKRHTRKLTSIHHTFGP